MTKNISKIHLEILDKERRELLSILLPVISGFVLSGGTALALQIAHRKSFDFDFFSVNPIKKNLAEKLSILLPIQNLAIDTPSELTFFTDKNIKVSLIHYPFPRAFQ